MFLNSKHIKKQICNGTIGIVTDIDKDKEIIRVAFCINKGNINIEIEPEPAHFNINGITACRIQFPLQNTFALFNSPQNTTNNITTDITLIIKCLHKVSLMLL